jgi:hypothetical protein
MKRKGKVACPCYAVADWAARYENHETRKLKSLLWIPTPVHHDGLGYRVVIAGEDGERVLAAWYLILQVAARSPVRGVLASESMPYEPRHLAAMTGAKSETFTEALCVLSEPEIGWLVRVPWPLPEKVIGRNAAGAAWHKSGDSPDAPGDSPDKTGAGHRRREGKQGKGTTGTEPEGIEKQDGNRTEGDRGKPSEGNGAEAGPVSDSLSSSDSVSVRSGPVSVDASERHAAIKAFKRHELSGTAALRFAVTGNPNGDIGASDVQEAIRTLPESEQLRIAAHAYAVKLKHRDKDAGYVVGVVRNMVKDLAAKMHA